MNFNLTIFPAVEAGNPNIRFMFETAKQMMAAKDTVADLLLFLQDKTKLMDDYSNMIIMEEKIDGEWIEYDDNTEYI